MRTLPVMLLLASTAVLLTGCSLSGPASAPKASTYETLDELESAYTSTGSTCPAWVEDDDIQAAAQSGTCGNGVVLSTYLNAADLLGEVKLLRDTASGTDDGSSDPPRTELLIGADWLVSGAHVRRLQPELGGRLVVINPAATD